MSTEAVGKIEWRAPLSIAIGDASLAVAQNRPAGGSGSNGLRSPSALGLIIKRLAWPLKKLHDDLLVDGYIEREIGALIHQYCRPAETYLDIGCGDMSVRRFVPKGFIYNALDIELSEFHARRVLAEGDRVNIIVASATHIPAETASASLILSTETFTFIDDITAALRELHRVAAPQARLICSISNEKCRKYEMKGPNPLTQHKWSCKEFADLMAEHGFALIEARQKGYWLPIPRWLTSISYQLPFTSRQERDNTNFFYVFEKR